MLGRWTETPEMWSSMQRPHQGAPLPKVGCAAPALSSTASLPSANSLQAALMTAPLHCSMVRGSTLLQGERCLQP